MWKLFFEKRFHYAFLDFKKCKICIPRHGVETSWVQI